MISIFCSEFHTMMCCLLLTITLLPHLRELKMKIAACCSHKSSFFSGLSKQFFLDSLQRCGNNSFKISLCYNIIKIELSISLILTSVVNDIEFLLLIIPIFWHDTLHDIQGAATAHVRQTQWSYYRIAKWKSAESPKCNTSATSKGQWWKFELCDTSATNKAN